MTEGSDFSWLRLLLASSVVLGLMGLLGFVLKYVGMRGISLPGRGVRPQRIQIVGSLPIDTRRRFVILRCDQREHLLLLTAQGDIVVEANLPPPSVPPAP